MNIDEFRKGIEGIKKEIKRLQTILNTPEEKYSWLKKGVEYWHIITNCGSELDYNDIMFQDDNVDKWNILTNNVFKTKAEAVEYKDFVVAIGETKYDFSIEEWRNNRIDKWHITYDHEDNNFSITNTYTLKKPNCIYFKTEGEALDFLNNYKKQIKKYWFGLEE